MPKKPFKICNKPGCTALTRNPDGYCDVHKIIDKKEHNSNRDSATERGYDHKWRKVRNQKLRLTPLCECQRCKMMGRRKPANVVHHIQAVDAFPELRLEMSNLQSMWHGCHEVEHGRKIDYHFEEWQREHPGHYFYGA